MFSSLEQGRLFLLLMLSLPRADRNGLLIRSGLCPHVE